VRFTLLGPMASLPPKERIVLAVLLLHAGKAVPVSTLARAIWDDDPTPSARNTIQGHIKRLRQHLGANGARIVTKAPGYLIEVHPGELDLHEFTRLRDEAAVAARAQDWKSVAALLTEALALWRGEPLSDVPSPFLRRTQVPRLAELHDEALEARLDADLHLGKHAAVTAELRRLVSEHPFRERLWELLMLALYRGGRQAEALDAYTEARRRLGTELGIDPGPRLRELHAQILASDPELTPRPRRGRPDVPRELPADLPDFTGRNDEFSRLRDLILAPTVTSPGTVPVVAISGPGGIGKTALAVHIAHDVAKRFPGGQLYVDLAGTSADPAQPPEVQARLLRDLGVQAEDIPADTDARGARYRSALAGRRVLLLLDDARNAAQVRPLLPGSAGCAVLVTSRARMPDLAASRRLDLAELDPGSGRELFAAIVGAVRADAEPEAAEEIIRFCAGLPLAIRIAAARLAAHPGWSVRSMAERLGAERNRLTELRADDMAVRASFRLSHSCLAPAEARGFGLLSLAPPGAFGLAAAAALFDLSLPETESVLGGLIDVHMLEEPEPGRYRLHDLLRLFASELSDSPAAARRLIEWYTAAIRSARVTMAPGRRMPPGVDEDVASAAQNVPVFATHREALTWCQAEEVALLWSIRTASARGWDDLTVAIASYIFGYYAIAGDPGPFEMTQRLGIASARRLGNDIAYATLQSGRGGALGHAGDHDEAIECFRAALEVRRRLGDRWGEAGARTNIALSYQSQGRFSEALAEHELSREIAEELGHKMLLGTVLSNSAETCQMMGDLDGALTRYSAAIGVLAEAGDRYMEGMAASGLGETLRLLGRLDDSLEQNRLALAILDDLGTGHHEQIAALDRLAMTLRDLGRVEEARQAWAKALDIAESTGDSRAAEFRHLADGDMPPASLCRSHP
jgi:DNA-binding SARP family transcriptional activator